jgi:putative membrane protein
MPNAPHHIEQQHGLHPCRETFMPAHHRNLTIVTIIWVLGLFASGFRPFDRLTWLMEVFPCVIALAFLWPTRKSFPLTPLLMVLIALHGLILMYGGAYTYAKVPLGFWLQDWIGFARNNYDKIGHFAQGFVPAILARELLIRKWGLDYQGRHRRLLPFLSVSICLAFSAFYELIEWGAALVMGQGADEFLGTQGYVWDTQSDMYYALLGAMVALVLLSAWHTRQIRALETSTSP